MKKSVEVIKAEKEQREALELKIANSIAGARQGIMGFRKGVRDLFEKISSLIGQNISESDVKQRSYQDLVNLVASLRYMADCYEDEIRDGQYNE